MSFLDVTLRHVLAETTTQGAPWKKLLQNRDKKKGEEWEIDNENNDEKLLQSRLLHFLLFDIKGNYK